MFVIFFFFVKSNLQPNSAEAFGWCEGEETNERNPRLLQWIAFKNKIAIKKEFPAVPNSSGYSNPYEPGQVHYVAYWAEPLHSIAARAG